MGGVNAAAWGIPNVLDFFRTARSSCQQVYRSEWFFLRPALIEGLSVLDVGCAQGGFVSVLSEHLQDFTYTGLDINGEMIAKARERHPDSRFIEIAEEPTGRRWATSGSIWCWCSVFFICMKGGGTPWRGLGGVPPGC
jgi:SAM-dependent methyltransferase